MTNPQPTNTEQKKELSRSVLSSIGAHSHLSDAQLRLFSSLKNYSQSGDTSPEQTTIDTKTKEIDFLNKQPIQLSLILESLREARATSCSQLKAEHSFVKTILGIKVFDYTIGAALTNGVLAAFPTSYIFAGLGYVATDDLGYRAGGRNYQPLVPGQKSGDINDATLYVQHADRNRFFDVGIERIPVTLGNYDKLKTEYYTQFLNQKHQEEITDYVLKQKDKKQLTAQDLEDLTNLAKLLELLSQESKDAETIKQLLYKQQSEFKERYNSSKDAEIKESDSFFINYQSQIGNTNVTVEDQQIARIKYELLDKQYNQRERKKYITELTNKEQLTAQDLEDLTNLAKLLEESSQKFNDSNTEIKKILHTQQSEFKNKYISPQNNSNITQSDIFFIEKLLLGEIDSDTSLTLDDMLTKVNNYQSQTGDTNVTFEDQQIARIKYELLDKKYNQGERTEELKNQTLQALNNARSIAEKRQENFLKKLNQLSVNDDFNDCRYSTNFYDKLNQKEELTNYKDLFDDCENWASHHPQCSDGLKEFLEAVVENKKQTTNYLLTKDRTFTEKAQDVANFYKNVAALGGIFVGLQKLGLEHHFAEWGREAGIAISNNPVGHFIANNQLAHTATAFASTVANSAPVHAISTGIISVTKGLVGLFGAVKSIPMAPVVVAGGAGVLATGVYLRGMDYPEQKSIQDIISVAKENPSGFCSCYHSHSMGEQEVTIPK